MKAQSRQWMAIYTKPRNEKKVAERLDLNGVEVYCPLQTTIRQWSDRKKKVKIPVFPSYVFLKIQDRERTEILQDPGILNFVFWLGKPAIIREDEIDAIQTFLGENEDAEFEVVDIREGENVRIRSGAFANESAVVSKIHRSSKPHKSRVVLHIESLGMIVRVTTPITNIEQS